MVRRVTRSNAQFRAQMTFGRQWRQVRYVKSFFITVNTNKTDTPGADDRLYDALDRVFRRTNAFKYSPATRRAFNPIWRRAAIDTEVGEQQHRLHAHIVFDVGSSRSEQALLLDISRLKEQIRASLSHHGFVYARGQNPYVNVKSIANSDLIALLYVIKSSQ